MAKTKNSSPLPPIHFNRYEDFRRWVQNQPGYWILVKGIPMPSPSPSRKHQEIAAKLFLLLERVVHQTGKGYVYFAPLDVKLAEDTVYQPDLLVVLQEHSHRLHETHIEGPPDLVVEILSPSSAKLDLWEKRHDYDQAGVQEYWIIDPDTQAIELYSRKENRLQLVASAQKQGQIQSHLLPDLTIDLQTLF